jgi:hypothetical protein
MVSLMENHLNGQYSVYAWQLNLIVTHGGTEFSAAVRD